jgi:hypothetical protein
MSVEEHFEPIEEEDAGDIPDLQPDEEPEEVVYEFTVSTGSIEEAGEKTLEAGVTGMKSYLAYTEYQERQREIRRQARRAKFSDLLSVFSLLSRFF